MADFFLVFHQAAESDFTPSNSERIECLTAMRNLNAFCRKIDRIVNFWKRKFLGTRFRCKLRSHGTGKIEDKLSTGWIFMRLGDLLTEPVKNLNANLGQIFSRYGRKFDQRDLNTITMAVRVQIPIIRRIPDSSSRITDSKSRDFAIHKQIVSLIPVSRTHILHGGKQQL